MIASGNGKIHAVKSVHRLAPHPPKTFLGLMRLVEASTCVECECGELIANPVLSEEPFPVDGTGCANCARQLKKAAEQKVRQQADLGVAS